MSDYHPERPIWLHDPDHGFVVEVELPDGRSFTREQIEAVLGGLPASPARPDIPPHKKYPMCEPQPVQLDCRVSSCVFHADGACHNVAPALTVMAGPEFAVPHWTCHSRRDHGQPAEEEEEDA